MQSLNEAFEATAGQKIFKPTKFVLNVTPLVWVNGAEQNWGWSVIGGAVEFADGQLQGTRVVIIK